MTQRGIKEACDSRALYEKRQLKAIAARWDAKADTWDNDLRDPECHLNEDNAYELFLTHLLNVINQRQHFCSKNGVIDAGCATGLVLAKAVAYFAWGIGVDISSEMIQVARSKHIPNASFIVGDCFELGKISTKAGAVISRGVLLSHYGIKQAKSLLVSAREALLPGGFLLCDFLNQVNREKYKHLPGNKTYFLGAEICKLASEAGFQSAEILGEPERRVQLLLAH